jgi:hypothetical protein
MSAHNTVAVGNWADAITTSLLETWNQFMAFLPNVIVALVVFFIGWAIAVAIGRLVEKVLVVMRVNAAFESMKGLKNAVEQAGLKLNVSRLIGEIFKWFLLIVTLLATTDILGLRDVSQFLTEVLLYVPNVAVAALILVISVILANFVYKTVLASVEAAGFTSGGAIAAVSKWSIIIFAIFAALLQLNVATQLIQTFLTALFAMIAIAGGLAFGLGGKDLATKWLNHIEHDLTGKRK